MQLYLSSYRLGNDSSFLKKWCSEHNNNIVVIPNAADHLEDGEEKTNKIIDKCRDLEMIGFKTRVVDLRNYFNKKDELFEELKNENTFYVIGGNSFVLRTAMKLSGFDDYIRSKTDDDNFLYSGFSAGICVLAPGMQGLELVDDPNIDPYHTSSTDWDGVGILDYLPVPHYKSEHPETIMVEKTVEYLVENNIRFRTLRDGEVIIDHT